MYESFYTYLGGPRTFSGNDIYIRNNFYGGMPNFCCFQPYNCSNFGNNLMGLLMLNSVMVNTFSRLNNNKVQPEYQQQYNPYMQPNYLIRHQRDRAVEIRDMLDSQGYTENNGFGIIKDSKGDLLIKYKKDGIECTGRNLQELFAKINELDKKNSHDNNDEEIVVDDGTVNEPVLGEIENENYSWKEYSDLTDKEKETIKKGTSIETLAKTIIPKYETMSEEEKEKVLTLLRNANTEAIKDDKIVEAESLNIILPDGIRTLPEGSETLDNNYAYRIQEDNLTHYYKPTEEGTWVDCTDEDFKKECEEKYNEVKSPKVIIKNSSYAYTVRNKQANYYKKDADGNFVECEATEFESHCPGAYANSQKALERQKKAK